MSPDQCLVWVSLLLLWTRSSIPHTTAALQEACGFGSRSFCWCGSLAMCGTPQTAPPGSGYQGICGNAMECCSGDSWWLWGALWFGKVTASSSTLLGASPRVLTTLCFFGEAEPVSQPNHKIVGTEGSSPNQGELLVGFFLNSDALQSHQHRSHQNIISWLCPGIRMGVARGRSWDT